MISGWDSNEKFVYMNKGDTLVFRLCHTKMQKTLTLVYVWFKIKFTSCVSLRSRVRRAMNVILQCAFLVTTDGEADEKVEGKTS